MSFEYIPPLNSTQNYSNAEILEMLHITDNYNTEVFNRDGVQDSFSGNGPNSPFGYGGKSVAPFGWNYPIRIKEIRYNFYSQYSDLVPVFFFQGRFSSGHPSVPSNWEQIRLPVQNFSSVTAPINRYVMWFSIWVIFTQAVHESRTTEWGLSKLRINLEFPTPLSKGVYIKYKNFYYPIAGNSVKNNNAFLSLKSSDLMKIGGTVYPLGSEQKT